MTGTINNNEGLPNIRTPFFLGFFLVRPDVRVFRRPKATYRGIDRLVYTPNLVMGRHPSSKEKQIDECFDKYMAARESGDLHASINVAKEFQIDFGAIGIVSEIIFAEIVEFPEWQKLVNGETLRANLVLALQFRMPIHRRIESRPADAELLGYDVSDPMPTFHSAIFQPWLQQPLKSEVPMYLNENGLFRNVSSARDLLQVANEAGNGRCFCTLGIYKVH
jgi:hypothetical protein